MAPRAHSTGQISPPMAERQTGSDRFPELGGLCFGLQRPNHFSTRTPKETERIVVTEKTERTTEPRPALENRFRLELDFRLERWSSSKNELDIYFYIERLLSSHVAWPNFKTNFYVGTRGRRNLLSNLYIVIVMSAICHFNLLSHLSN